MLVASLCLFKEKIELHGKLPILQAQKEQQCEELMALEPFQAFSLLRAISGKALRS